jgi:hypothetical protein
MHSMKTSCRGRLVANLAALERVPGGHPEPIIEFRRPGGFLISSYYVSTFQAIDGEGLMLDSDETTLTAESVAACQAWLREVLP